MLFMGKAHLNIMWVVEPDDEAVWDRLFASHGQWMKGHPREGNAALLRIYRKLDIDSRVALTRLLLARRE